MPTIDELARIKTTDINRLEMARKKLKISGVFISHCLGLSGTVWSSWVTQRGSIPAKHLDRVVEILVMVSRIQAGDRLLPAKKNPNGVSSGHLEMIKEFLEFCTNPKIGIFEDRCEALEKILKQITEEAQTIMELMNEA